MRVKMLASWVTKVEQAKFFTKVVGPKVLTEGGIKQQLTARRKAERAQVGRGGERVARWGWRAATHCRVI